MKMKQLFLSLVFLSFNNLTQGSSQLSVSNDYTVSRYSNLPGGVHGLAMLNNGNLLFSDSYARNSSSRRVFRLDFSTNEKIATQILGKSPSGLLVHGDKLFVADMGAHYILQFQILNTTEFQVVKKWDIPSPWNLDIAKDGRIYAVSYEGQVYELLENSSIQMLFQGLEAPFGIKVGDDGTLWISEQGSIDAKGRVTKRSLTGEILHQIEHQFNIPEGIVIDKTGHLWIADTGDGKVYKFDGSKVELITDQIHIPIVMVLGVEGELYFNAKAKNADGSLGIDGIYKIESNKLL